MLIVEEDFVPDTVRLPLELGGFITQVVSSSRIPCPCKGPHIVLDLELKYGGFHVAECSDQGFLWYRRGKKPEADDDRKAGIVSEESLCWGCVHGIPGPQTNLLRCLYFDFTSVLTTVIQCEKHETDPDS